MSGKTQEFILILKIWVTNCIPSSSRHARYCADISSMPLALDLMSFIIFLVSSHVKGCNSKIEWQDTLSERVMVLKVSCGTSGCVEDIEAKDLQMSLALKNVKGEGLDLAEIP